MYISILCPPLGSLGVSVKYFTLDDHVHDMPCSGILRTVHRPHGDYPNNILYLQVELYFNTMRTLHAVEGDENTDYDRISFPTRTTK